MKNAPNKKLAEQFVKFAITKGFQDHIPYGNWMYPIIDGVEGNSDFYKYAPVPNSLDRVYGSTEDKALWINYWSSSID